MSTADCMIECLDVEVEYEFHPEVRAQLWKDIVQEGARVELISVHTIERSQATEPGERWHYRPIRDIMSALPDSVLDDIREQILKGELAGPDPDRKHDERGE